MKDTNIDKIVWIGTNSCILKGVTIGDNSVISAMSVVAKSGPANCIVTRNPAKAIKQIANQANF